MRRRRDCSIAIYESLANFSAVSDINSDKGKMTRQRFQFSQPIDHCDWLSALQSREIHFWQIWKVNMIDLGSGSTSNKIVTRNAHNFHDHSSELHFERSMISQRQYIAISINNSAAFFVPFGNHIIQIATRDSNSCVRSKVCMQLTNI